MDRKTLKIKANTDNVVKFLFDTPIEGTNKYGVYHLYAFDHNGEEVSLFATDNLHEKLRSFAKGDAVNIRKEEYEAGKFGWNVIPEEGTPLRNTPSNISDKSEPSKAVQESRQYHATQNDNRTKDIHRQVCLKLAVQSMDTSETLDFDMVKFRMDGLLSVLEGEETKEELPF